MKHKLLYLPLLLHNQKLKMASLSSKCQTKQGHGQKSFNNDSNLHGQQLRLKLSVIRILNLRRSTLLFEWLMKAMALDRMRSRGIHEI